MMKYIFAILAVSLLIIGCGPKVAEEVPTGCYPQNVKVDVNDGMMDVSWKNSCDQLISGYNVYISEQEPATASEPNNNGPFPGDTNPDDGIEHYKAEHLENGKKYYVSVRIIKPDQTLSKPSNEVVAVCGPRGDIDLSVRYKSDKDGYSLEKNEYVRADNVDNDLYFYSKDGKDYISSPNKLDGFLRNNRFGKINYKGDFDGLKKKLSSMSINSNEDRISVKKGDWFVLRTADNKTALFQVKDFSGSGEQRHVSLFFAFSPLAGEMIF